MNVLNREPLTFVLSHSYLWGSTEYSTWPRLLADCDETAHYTDKEIRLGIFKSGLKRPVGSNPQSIRISSDYFNNIWDLQLDDEDTVRWRGLCLVEKTESDKYQLNPWAQDLARLFRTDPAGNGWKAKLVEILGKYDPRMRLILWFLGKNACVLRVPGTVGTLGSIANGVFVNLDFGPDVEPFAGQKHSQFNELLEANTAHMVGPFIRTRMKRLGIDPDRPIIFSGKQAPKPSTKQLPQVLGWGLRPLLDLKWLRYSDEAQGWILDYDACEDWLPAELLGDLIVPEVKRGLSVDLERAYREVRRPDGLVAYEAFYNALVKMGGPLSIRELDLELAQCIRERTVALVFNRQGLRSDGRGYQDDSNFQLIELDFIG